MIHIFTTAAPPWMTGTALNPTMRACTLANMGYCVCIVYPWLVLPQDQMELYGRVFANRYDQESFVRSMMPLKLGDMLDVRFYNARYERKIGCILHEPYEDITSKGICTGGIVILEEPEHLCWLHIGDSWKHKFDQVIGVIHTNYDSYMQYDFKKYGAFKVGMRHLWEKLILHAYVDTVIHLSPATTTTTEGSGVVSPVHGVRSLFFKPLSAKAHGIYFIGKCLWNKGYQNIQQLFADFKTTFDVHSFGSGPDAKEITAAAQQTDGWYHNSAVSHESEIIRSFSIFFNPSTSEVLCTSTMEAIAMGKIVVLPNHSSNDALRRFTNTRFYDTLEECAMLLHTALSETPQPLTKEEERWLSWSAACERLEAFFLLSDKEHIASTDVAFLLMQGVLNAGMDVICKIMEVHMSLSKSHAIPAIIICLLILGSGITYKGLCHTETPYKVDRATLGNHGVLVCRTNTLKTNCTL